ncbi:MAG: HlyD family secretion protein [Rhodobacteraceae bacterium]|nr:HlyD family secretion protein [Paracoccaceae bacterium]
MLKTKVLTTLGAVYAALVFPLKASESVQSIALAGTVIADNKATLSYETRGCINRVSQDALKSSLASVDQVLVELDDRSAALSLKTAQAVLSDLRAALEERAFAVQVAKAEILRVTEEQTFVNKEYDRTLILFQRGLVNETTLDNAERKKLDATFALQRAEEDLKRSISTKSRAEISLEIGQLEYEVRLLDVDALKLRAPFDGVLLDFMPKVGDCVAQGALAASIYAPEEKSVETYIYVEQLVEPEKVGVVIGKPVNVVRTNGQVCDGMFSLIGTEANLESQNVKATIELEAGCAAELFLNEAVTIVTNPD